jgi:hypothetical protein
MHKDCRLFVMLGVIVASALLGTAEAPAQGSRRPILIDNFEGYTAGQQPYHWKRPHKRSRSLLDLEPALERDDDYFEIVNDGGSKRARAYTKNESVQLVRLNGDGYQWDLRTHPRLAWAWRAIQLPRGAREDEDRYNDTGAALYVTFGTDWLGRPRSIKYTYSSMLPVGTTAKFGPLWVVVVASGADGLGDWVRLERDVVADYKRLFDKDPPDEPVSITLWGDSDNTEGISDVYFDDIELLPARGGS